MVSTSVMNFKGRYNVFIRICKSDGICAKLQNKIKLGATKVINYIMQIIYIRFKERTNIIYKMLEPLISCIYEILKNVINNQFYTMLLY